MNERTTEADAGTDDCWWLETRTSLTPSQVEPSELDDLLFVNWPRQRRNDGWPQEAVRLSAPGRGERDRNRRKEDSVTNYCWRLEVRLRLAAT